MSEIDKFLPRTARMYLYGIAIAFVPLAVYFGWIEPEAAPIILPLIVAILNITPKEKEDEIPNVFVEED